MSVHGLSAFLLLLFLLLVPDAAARCDPSSGTEWRALPRTVHVDWSLARGVCVGGARLSQLRPLQLQLGDGLLLAPDPALVAHGVRLSRVSEEAFRTCSAPGHAPPLRADADGTARVGAELLPAGSHYFTSVHQGGATPCHLGLRLNVTVREQRCRGGVAEPLCSGQGVCRVRPCDPAYTCCCPAPFSGSFCERPDPCGSAPCPDGASCVSEGLVYACLRPSRSATEPGNTAAVSQRPLLSAGPVMDPRCILRTTDPAPPSSRCPRSHHRGI